MRASSSALLGLFALGCGESGPSLALEFTDPVVEARARVLLAQVLGGVTRCEPVLAVQASEVAGLAGGVRERESPYPGDPAQILPPDVDDAPAVLHVIARDADGLVVVRGCAPLAEALATGVLTLRALPLCAEAPSVVDLAVVYDASSDMTLADATFGGVASIFNAAFVQGGDFPPGSRFSLFVYGPSPVRAVINAADDIEGLQTASVELEMGYGGEPDVFGGIFWSARVLRDRASCRRLPALVALAAGGTRAGAPILFADAAFSLYAAVGDPSDDIFAYGIGLSQEATADLGAAIPEGVGELASPQTASALREALGRAHFEVRRRVNLR